jgi:hypothetical protein
MSKGLFKTFKTPDGIQISTFCEPDKKPVFHSLDGPAMRYPKAMKKVDEYYIYGIKYTKTKWEEAKDDAKVKYVPIDPKLEGTQ